MSSLIDSYRSACIEPRQHHHHRGRELNTTREMFHSCSTDHICSVTYNEFSVYRLSSNYNEVPRKLAASCFFKFFHWRPYGGGRVKCRGATTFPSGARVVLVTVVAALWMRCDWHTEVCLGEKRWVGMEGKAMAPAYVPAYGRCVPASQMGSGYYVLVLQTYTALQGRIYK